MVSIIVPVYNIKEYLPACVESLLRQSYTQLEILLVDDGASDGSGALCDKLAEQDTRIKVIHKTNGGLSSARNAGLEEAAGDWILFVDGDDYLIETAVEQLLQIAEEDADFVQFLYQETTDTSWRPGVQEANAQTYTKPSDFFRMMYKLGGVGASACTKLYRRTVFQELRFAEGLRHEDEELMTRLLPRCRKVLYTDLTLYGYVTRQGSIIHSDFNPKSMDVFPIMEARTVVLKELGCTELEKQTQQRTFQTAAWLFCKARKGGYKKEAQQLKMLIISIARREALSLTGQYKLVYQLSRITGLAPDAYYWIRRICGKT